MKNPVRTIYAKLMLWIAPGMSRRLHEARRFLYADFGISDVNVRNLDQEALIWIINYHDLIAVRLAAVRRLALIKREYMGYIIVNHALEEVRAEAIRECHNQPQCVNAALHDESELVRQVAVAYVTAPAQLERLARALHPDVRIAYLDRLQAFAPSLYALQKDPDAKVRNRACRIIADHERNLRRETAGLTHQHHPQHKSRLN